MQLSRAVCFIQEMNSLLLGLVLGTRDFIKRKEETRKDKDPALVTLVDKWDRQQIRN